MLNLTCANFPALLYDIVPVKVYVKNKLELSRCVHIFSLKSRPLGHLLGLIGRWALKLGVMLPRYKSGAALSALPRATSGRGIIRMLRTLRSSLAKVCSNVTDHFFIASADIFFLRYYACANRIVPTRAR